MKSLQKYWGLYTLISWDFISWIMDKSVKKMQSGHESLYNNSNHNIIVPYLNCNPISTPLHSKHESKLTRENPKPNCNRDRERLTKCCFELLSDLFNTKQTHTQKTQTQLQS